MDATKHKSDLHDLRSTVKQQRVTQMVLAVTVLLLVVFMITRKPTVVSQPPNGGQPMSMTGDRLDAAWLEGLALEVAHLMLDVTPQSSSWQRERILKMTHPDTHGDLEQRLTVQEKRLAEANATTSFWPQLVAPDVDGQRVVLMGRLDTLINGVRTSAIETAYSASFTARGGRTLIKDWVEVPKDDPWLAKAAEQKLQAEKKGKKK